MTLLRLGESTSVKTVGVCYEKWVGTLFGKCDNEKAKLGLMGQYIVIEIQALDCFSRKPS
jgi:hypothetical protein